MTQEGGAFRATSQPSTPLAELPKDPACHPQGRPNWALRPLPRCRPGRP